MAEIQQLTPHISDPSRGLYERYYKDGNTVCLETMHLDTMVDAVHKAISSYTLDSAEAYEKLIEYRTGLFETINHRNVIGNSKENHVDIHRFVMGAELALERSLAPYLFGANTDTVQRQRSETLDGIEGVYIETISSSLEILSKLAKEHTSASPVIDEWRRHIRGSIQEDTVAALLNTNTDDLLVVPSTLRDDVMGSTDLFAYYIAENGQGYKSNISVKSTRDDALREQAKRLPLVVLYPSHFNNYDLHISDILARQYQGTPGISREEERELEHVRQKLYMEFITQIKKIPHEPLRQHGSSELEDLPHLSYVV